ncbi:MAG TPA: sensor histidine kinase [Gemmatimonadaceae bacterium]|jgi:signal transduction histidine kinase
MTSARLSTFIRQNAEPILSEWEAFARTLPRGSSMDVDALRNHAKAMLEDIARDMETPQTERERSDKSKGVLPQRHTVAATEHGHARAGSGFTVVEMVAEFRALRATVIRLWTAQLPQFAQAEADDLIRFNEAIDQAVAESLERYAGEINETRERFLAILGHDLKNPLGAIAASVSLLRETASAGAERSKVIQIIQNATLRMTNLVADMLELALSRLGDDMPVRMSEVNMRDVIERVVAEIRATYPTAQITTSFHGDLAGHWDASRLTQALTNLIANAAQHGDLSKPIHVIGRGDRTEVSIEVRNSGPTIGSERLRQLFEGRSAARGESRDRRHLGLGLFIVDKIVAAHGGSIDVRSANSETAFVVHLPRAELGRKPKAPRLENRASA